MIEPKVFISYSWSGKNHQELVRHWADRLIADGVDVILDLYDLKEGHDKYVFMEKMVTDPTVTHVLVMCDRQYAEKANARRAGVGTESQIISSEVYGKVEQSKFIPIVCEFGEEGEPMLPAFMKSRMWINFSTSESANENWEQLVRLLYGKPQHQKPSKGSMPNYVVADSPSPTTEVFAKFNTLRQAVLQDKKGIKRYRSDFFDSCIAYADRLRVRQGPNMDSFPERVTEDCGKLKAIRDHLCDWVLLEGEIADQREFSEAVIEILEKLRELTSRPAEVTTWNDMWFEAHRVFAFETFLYVVAALLKTGSYQTLHEIYSSHYLAPATDRQGQGNFQKFDCFWTCSDALKAFFASEGRNLNSPVAELMKRQASREDLPFDEIIQAELLTLLLSFITCDVRWYPQTLHYAGYSGSFPFFIRAAQHKHFHNLSQITGIDSADDLREKVKEGHERLEVAQWRTFHFDRSFWSSMNMDNLDTLK